MRPGVPDKCFSSSASHVLISDPSPEDFVLENWFQPALPLEFELDPGGFLQHTVIRHDTVARCAAACNGYTPAFGEFTVVRNVSHTAAPKSASSCAAPPPFHVTCKAFAFDRASRSCAIYSSQVLRWVNTGNATESPMTSELGGAALGTGAPTLTPTPTPAPRQPRSRFAMHRMIRGGGGRWKPDMLKPCNSSAYNRPNAPPITEESALPRVLLIGDSISIDYTLETRSRLEGVANVHRIFNNGRSTAHALTQKIYNDYRATSLYNGVGDGVSSYEETRAALQDMQLVTPVDGTVLTRWLAQQDFWDVIHFNFGLHDLKRVGPSGEDVAYMEKKTYDAFVSKYAAAGVNVSTSTLGRVIEVKEYVANLEAVVRTLEQTGAVLIWCSTTPVSATTRGRVEGDVGTYNEAAAKVMLKHGIRTHDLYHTAASLDMQTAQRDDGVHFTYSGSSALAESVANAVKSVVGAKSTAVATPTQSLHRRARACASTEPATTAKPATNGCATACAASRGRRLV